MTSAIYNGTVIHKRFKPKIHFFRYKVFSLLIDLSDLNYLNKKISFFSYNSFNLISFFDKDHGDRDGSSLIDWVKKNLIQNNINSENIKIKLYFIKRPLLVNLIINIILHKSKIHYRKIIFAESFRE